jgi:hypothetical protein
MAPRRPQENEPPGARHLEEAAAMTTTQHTTHFEDRATGERPVSFFTRLRNLALAPFAVLALGLVLLVLVLWRAH